MAFCNGGEQLSGNELGSWWNLPLNLLQSHLINYLVEQVTTKFCTLLFFLSARNASVNNEKTAKLVEISSVKIIPGRCEGGNHWWCSDDCCCFVFFPVNWNSTEYTLDHLDGTLKNWYNFYKPTIGRLFPLVSVSERTSSGRHQTILQHQSTLLRLSIDQDWLHAERKIIA